MDLLTAGVSTHGETVFQSPAGPEREVRPTVEILSHEVAVFEKGACVRGTWPNARQLVDFIQTRRRRRVTGCHQRTYCRPPEYAFLLYTAAVLAEVLIAWLQRDSA